MTKKMFVLAVVISIIVPLLGLAAVTYEAGRIDGMVALLAAQSKVKTYKVTMSKSNEGHNRTVYIKAETSDEARKTARDQNPGWQVEDVTEEHDHENR